MQLRHIVHGAGGKLPPYDLSSRGVMLPPFPRFLLPTFLLAGCFGLPVGQVGDLHFSVDPRKVAIPGKDRNRKKGRTMCYDCHPCSVNHALNSLGVSLSASANLPLSS